MKEDSPHGIWNNIAEKMLLEFAESGCPIFRATTPLSRGQLRSKGHGKLSIHFAAAQETVEKIVSANHLSLYGAVAEMCEEYETLHDRSSLSAAKENHTTDQRLPLGRKVLQSTIPDLGKQFENVYEMGPVLTVSYF